MKKLITIIILILIILTSIFIYFNFNKEPEGEFATIEGLCEIERKTMSWRIVNGVVLTDLTKEQESQCVNKTVKVSGYMTLPECNPPGSQCYMGNFLQVESIEFLD